MPEKHDKDHSEDELKQLLMGELTLSSEKQPREASIVATSHVEDDLDNTAYNQRSSDVQGALGLFAEATQDMATATVELALGRHFACVDF